MRGLWGSHVARRAAPVVLVAALLGCQAIPGRGPGESLIASDSLERNSADYSSRLIDEGLKRLGIGELDKARAHFDAALRLDPRNATAHFLVAEVYRLREGGDRTAAALAEVGYLQALEFEPSLWPAAAGLGQLWLRGGRYAEAREQFARAALYQPRDASILYGFAVSSYHSLDMRTALPAIREAERLAPGNARLLPAVAIISAAAGDSTAAERALARLSDEVTPRERARLRERIADWTSLLAALGPELLAQQPFPPQPFPPQPLPGGPPAMAPLAAPVPPLGGKRAKMVQVDVIIVRTEEIETARRGVNLLDNLALQFSASRTRTDTRTLDSAAGLTTNVQRVITRAIGIPQIQYSLNIANDSLDNASVVARPTLVATDGQPATFFSGEHVILALPGNFAGNIEEREIGVNLAVTPTFLDDDTVLLNVAASRSFLNLGNPLLTGTFQQALQTTKQSVNTAVAVKFGETLILSGLSERQVERQRSAVPLLGDLPLIQYLFNRTNETEFSKSVLMLLTPRRVESTPSTGPASAAEANTPQGPAMQRLYAQFPQLFRAPATLDLIRLAIQRNAILSPVRPRDLPLDPNPELHQPRTLERRLRELIYY